MSSGVAILGAGIFAKEAHLPALAALGAAAPALKAVYSRSQASAHDLADAAVISLSLSVPPGIYHDIQEESTNLDALFARQDIDTVVIALPITLQPSIILRALAAGKHVLSEKPVAPDVAGGLELIKTYNEQYKPKGLIWRVAENFEAEPGYRAAAQAIAAGRIGEVICFRTVVYNYIDKNSKWYKTPWRTVPDYQGGFLLDGGVHTIAALRIILPHALTHLTSFASLHKDYLAPHDTIHAIVRAGPVITGTAELTFAAPTETRPKADSFVFTGTKGWLTINQVGSVLRVHIHTNEKTEVLEEPVCGVQAELGAFFAAVRKESGALAIGEPLEALRDVGFIQAALRSAGQLVDLTELVPSAL
ncbi:hypothetical protein H0H81_009000 [Sphagnurus paluster]|uniref:Oxidoreductase n=1 Tax=Sphagnurus paluster TaxID=117069 RepID=A0A9P7FPX2_9AGAR|nr:hypothetical protein H0H81_009000 [Sphagnurus paluster]